MASFALCWRDSWADRHRRLASLPRRSWNWRCGRRSGTRHGLTIPILRFRPLFSHVAGRGRGLSGRGLQHQFVHLAGVERHQPVGARSHGLDARVDRLSGDRRRALDERRFLGQRRGDGGCAGSGGTSGAPRCVHERPEPRLIEAGSPDLRRSPRTHPSGAHRGRLPNRLGRVDASAGVRS